MLSPLYDKIEVNEAIENLRDINRRLRYSMDDAIFQDSALSAYLQRPLSEDIDADIAMEKAFKSVVYSSLRAKNRPIKMATRIADIACQKLRGERLAVLKAQDKISAQQYEKEKRKNSVIESISYVKRRFVRRGLKVALNAGISHMIGGKVITIMMVSGEPITMSVGWISFGLMTLADLCIPKEIKKKIRETAKKGIREAVDKLHNGITKLKQRAADTAHKVTTAISNGLHKAYEKGKQVVSQCKETFNECKNWVKEKASKLFHKIFS